MNNIYINIRTYIICIPFCGPQNIMTFHKKQSDKHKESTYPFKDAIVVILLLVKGRGWGGVVGGLGPP
jgi:hypothetical protein